ncbi:MAG: MnhB domain-containing protein [Verrucomicrobiota bacterium]
MKNPDSFILKTAAKILFFFINIFAVYLLLRGHNLPGGGFIAGLASAISVVLLGLAVGFREFEKMWRFDPMKLAAWGLLISISTALIPLVIPSQFEYGSFFEHKMLHFGDIHVGTTLLFDVGVLLVVIGISVKVVYVLARSTARRDSLVGQERYDYSSPVEEPIEAARRNDPEEVQDGS